MAQQVTIKYSDDSGDQNDIIQIDVTANGFTDVRNFNFITKWDDSLLEFESVENINSSFPSTEISFGTPDNTGFSDRVTCVFSQVGTIDYTLSPSDIIFSIQFKVLTSACVNTTIDTLNTFPRNAFFINNGSQVVNVSPMVNSGEAELNPCMMGSGENIIAVESVVGQPNTEVCVPITVKDMNDLGGFNGLVLNFDPNALTYNRVENKTAPEGSPLINSNNANIGELTMIYSYVDNNGDGITSDSTVLYCLCFTVVGDCETMTPLTLDEANSFNIANSDGNPIDHEFEDGSVSINCCSATATVTPVACFGENTGSITLTPDGCANITSVTWTNTSQTGLQITNLGAGTYDATITFDGGSSSTTITGVEVGGPTAALSASADITKIVNGNDGAIDLTVSGGTPSYTYQWSNGQTMEDISNLGEGNYSVTVTDANDCSEVFGPFAVATAPRITGVVSNVTCAGTATGSVDISVTGGAVPYSYTWSCDGVVSTDGDISGLSAGTCTVTVTDAANCSSTMEFTISGPANGPLVATVNQVTDDAGNNGNGAISLNVSGGWGDYSYTWQDEFNETYPDQNPLTGLFGGSYSVTVTDGGGCETVIMNIMVAGLRVVATDIQGVQCFGDNNGAIDIVVIGGSGVYSYDWSCNGTIDDDGNISGLTSGPCTVTVTDMMQNRQAIATFVVPGSTAALDVSVSSTCVTSLDGTASATVTGGLAPYTFNWNTTPQQTTSTISDLSAGSYAVLVRDSLGCEVMGLTQVASCDMEECFEAMDVITPNEDGKNDFFIIDCATTTNNRLRIFTRWGEEVISFTNYQNDWNGVDEGGNLVNEDTYMWVLETYPSPGNTVVYKGAVSVIYELR